MNAIAALLLTKNYLKLLANLKSRAVAFEAIIKKYQQKVYWHACRIVIDHDDADDVTQNTFIKAWENLENFREEAEVVYLVVSGGHQRGPSSQQKKASLYSSLLMMPPMN